MNSQDYKYVITITEMGSFSRAAEKLYISQPTLSKCVASLERSLGYKLFDRSRVPIQLTRAGEVFFKYAQSIVAMEELMEQEMLEPRKIIFKIGVSGVLSRTVLPNILPEFIEKYPNLMIQVVDGGRIDLENFAHQEMTDLTILSQPSFISSALHYEMLDEQRLLLAVPAGHRWYRAENGAKPVPFPFNAAELSKENFVLPTAKHSTRHSINRFMEDFNINLNSSAEVNHYENSLLIARRTEKLLAFVDEFYIHNVILSEDIEKTWPVNYYYFDKWDYRIRIYAIYRRKTAEVAEIIKLYRQMYKDHG